MVSVRSDTHSPTQLRTILDWEIVPKLRAVPGVIEVNTHPAVDWEELVRITTVLEEEARRNDDVEAGAAGDQLALQHLVAVVVGLDDLDAGRLGEIVERVGGPVVRPVEEIEDLFLLRRNTSRSALFGQGAHACLGQHLARLEMRIFFEELLGRLERIEIAGRPRRSASIFIGGPKTLPIRFKMN